MPWPSGPASSAFASRSARAGSTCSATSSEKRHAAGAALVIGALAAQLATRSIASLLFGVGAMDVVTYLGAALVLVIVVLIGTGLPARRAARVDPLIALRHE